MPPAAPRSGPLLVLALASGLPAVARAQPSTSPSSPPRLLVTLVGERTAHAEVERSLVARLAPWREETRWRHLPAMPLETPLRPDPDAAATLARLWVLLDDGEAVLFVVDGPWRRILVRRVPAPRGLDAVVGEQLALIARRAVEALAAEERGQGEAPAFAPLPARPTVRPRASQEGSSPAHATSPARRPDTPWRLGAVLGLRAWAPADGRFVGLLGPRLGWRPAAGPDGPWASLGIDALLPATHGGPDASVTWWGLAVRLDAGWRGSLGARFAWLLGASAAQEWIGWRGTVREGTGRGGTDLSARFGVLLGLLGPPLGPVRAGLLLRLDRAVPAGRFVRIDEDGEDVLVAAGAELQPAVSLLLEGSP